ncbi:glycoside hydrolase family 13 protein [Moheibacter sediminis]|uniref:Glycosidase n=1 Tax=Moheibacter sediminis TaxID=1434700 RepID=A0A1W2C8J5_9FLAO|nr:glycoside hydrolase family 13 protein [Moheibacter sediminis]SMC81426.1 Glycosidase [Moheibacter sediminis]
MKKLNTIILLLILNISFAQVQKIEPEFWWSGMKSTELQLLVYGKNISDLKPEISGDIQIKEVQKVENPNYLFVTIDTKGIQPGKVKLNFKKGKKITQSFDYEFKSRENNSADRKGFDSSDVFYLLMPDRFSNGKTRNDFPYDSSEGVDRNNPNGRHGGDIQGIINNLDYLNELGVTTIWSTPMFEDNEPVYSYHGYAQSDYYQIDPRYGTNEDYKRLANELHKREMKLVKDYVTNHWGSKHWIIKDLPSKDWIHYWENGENGFQRSNYRMTTQFDGNAAKIDAEGCMDGWFDTTMPDMNQKNPLVLNYMVQNAIWWIEYANLDGLRVDTYSYNDKEGIAEWTKRIMNEYPNFNIVGEIWMHDQAQMAYWQKDSKIGAIQGFNSHLPSVMDFTLHDAIGTIFKEEPSWDKGMIKVYENFTNDFLYPDIDNIMVFAENHDTSRFNEIYPNIEDYKLALSLIMTVRGIPQIYYGSEIGMKGDKSKGDGDIRRDFPGGWQGDKNNAFTESGRTTEQKAYFDFTKKLLNWRKGNSAIHKGKTLHYVPQENVYVYFRHDENQRVMIVLNNNQKAQKLDLKRFSEGIQNHKSGKDILSDKEFNLNNELEIKGKTALIIELK